MQLVNNLRIRSWIVAGTLAGSAVMAIGVPAAHAGVNCVVSAGVTQTATTVTGTNGNDTIACGGEAAARRSSAGAETTPSQARRSTTRSVAAPAATP